MLSKRVASWPMATRVFLVLASFQLLACFTLLLSASIAGTTQFQMSIILPLLSSSLFMFGFAVWGVWTENSWQLFAFEACALWMLIRLGYLWRSEISTSPEMMSVDEAFFRILFICSLVYVVLVLILGVTVYHSFGWRAHLKVGADPVLISMYEKYQQLQTSLIMDLQFSIAFVTASSPAYLHINQGSAIAFDIAVMVLNCLWATNGLISVRWESVVLMRVFLCMSLIKPCYCLLSLHLMVTTLENQGDGDEMALGVTSAESRHLSEWLLLCACALVAWRVLTVALACQVYSNFTRGLREVVFSHKTSFLEIVYESCGGGCFESNSKPAPPPPVPSGRSGGVLRNPLSEPLMPSEHPSSEPHGTRLKRMGSA